MKHVLFVLCVTLGAGGCAVIDMPASDDANPSWVDERLDRAGDRREAPPVVPVTSLPQSEAGAMDAATQRLLDERAAMQAEAVRRDEENRRGDASDFVSDGQARTQPPQQ